MIRVLLFSIEILLLQISVFAVGGEKNPTCHSINAIEVIKDGEVLDKTKKHKAPRKGKFFKRLQRTAIAKKIESISDKFFAQRCDIVVLKNGNEADVTITQITKEKVYYKACETVGPATDHFNIQEISKIKYANGEQIVFEAYKILKKNRTFWIGFMLGLFLLYLGIPIILVAYKGKRRKKALLGACVAYLLLLMYILIIILFVI